MLFEVFDENRLTRDDFLGLVELNLNNIPNEDTIRDIPSKYYILRPRSARSRVRGYIQVYHAYCSMLDNPRYDVNQEVNNFFFFFVFFCFFLFFLFACLFKIVCL